MGRLHQLEIQSQHPYVTEAEGDWTHAEEKIV